MAATAQILSFDVKKAFIRDTAIMKQVDRQKGRALRRFGSIVRRQARKKLKKGPRFSKVKAGGKRKRKSFKSQPGQPPLTHSDEPNLRSIWFAMEGRDTVIIGPVKLAGTKGRDVPHRLEYGGLNRPFMVPSLEEKYDELGKSIEKFGLV